MNNFAIRFPLERSSIIEMLQYYNVSPTRQRIEIAEFLFKEPQHLSADKILDGVKAEGKRVSRATVYNTMGLFVEKGIVREVLIDRERVFYDTNTDNHQHVYNVDSGELKDIYDIDINLADNMAIPDSCQVLGADIVIKVCSSPA